MGKDLFDMAADYQVLTEAVERFIDAMNIPLRTVEDYDKLIKNQLPALKKALKRSKSNRPV